MMHATLPPAPFALIRRNDWPHLALALLWAGIIKALVISNTVCIARDGVDYIQFAFYLQREPWPTVWRQSSHHPLYPLAIALAHRLLFPGRELEPETWQFAAQVVNFVASLFTTAAVFILARRLANKRVALGLTILFNALPGLARCLADALSEGLYLAGLSWSLAFAVHGLVARKSLFVWCSGLACGLAYWTRPEAALFAGAVTWTLLISLIIRPPPSSARWLITALITFILSLTLAIAPYCYIIGGLTAKPSGQQFLRSLSFMLPDNSWLRSSQCLAISCLATLRTHSLVSSLFLVLEEMAQGFFYAPLILVVPGIVLAIRKARTNLAWLLMLLYMAVHFLVLWQGNHILGYVTERYTYPITICGLLCAGLAWRHCSARLYRHCMGNGLASKHLAKHGHSLPIILLTSFIGLCVAKLLWQPLHQGAAGHRQAGYWLREHMKPSDNLFDPYGLAAFYSGRALVWTQQYPQGVGTPTGDWWLVLHQQERDQRVRERIVAFSAIAAEAEPVFYSSSDSAQCVVIYHLPGPVHKLSPLRGRYFPRVR